MSTPAKGPNQLGHLLHLDATTFPVSATRPEEAWLPAGTGSQVTTKAPWIAENSMAAPTVADNTDAALHALLIVWAHAEEATSDAA